MNKKYELLGVETSPELIWLDFSVDNKEEAIQVANAVDFGLSSAVFGEPSEAEEIAYEIKAGDVYLNSNGGSSELPFGGYKQSGVGREGGRFGLMEYLEPKSIHTA